MEAFVLRLSCLLSALGISYVCIYCSLQFPYLGIQMCSVHALVSVWYAHAALTLINNVEHPFFIKEIATYSKICKLCDGCIQ